MQKAVIGKILGIVGNLLLVMLLVGSIYLLVVKSVIGEENPSILGYSWAIVLSGSMEPEISVDDLIISHNQDDYEVGDIITYRSNFSSVTHRIVRKTDTGFVTKGDANNTEDEDVVVKEFIIGKVILAVPKAGILIEYIKTPFGMTSVILLGLFVNGALHIYRRFSED